MTLRPTNVADEKSETMTGRDAAPHLHARDAVAVGRPCGNAGSIDFAACRPCQLSSC